MSQVQKRAPMSDEKKKIVAEKRKAKIEAKKTAAYQVRIEDQRRQKIYKFYNQINEDHEKKTAELEEDRAKEEAWFQLHGAIHAKYCSVLTKTDMGTELYTVMAWPNTGSITAVIRKTLDWTLTQEQATQKDTSFFDSIKDIKNIKYEPCSDPSSYYGSYAGDVKNYWRVTFDLDL